MTPEDVKRMLHELDRKQPLESPADRWRREQVRSSSSVRLRARGIAI
jgi:hypothetical protein